MQSPLKIAMEELKNVVFNSLYIWMVAYNSLYFSIFLDFFFFFFFLIEGLFCIILVY